MPAADSDFPPPWVKPSTAKWVGPESGGQANRQVPPGLALGACRFGLYKPLKGMPWTPLPAGPQKGAASISLAHSWTGPGYFWALLECSSQPPPNTL
jgi:hypothetical protein